MALELASVIMFAFGMAILLISGQLKFSVIGLFLAVVAIVIGGFVVFERSRERNHVREHLQSGEKQETGSHLQR